MGAALTDTVIERHRPQLGRRCRHIRIDLGPINDPTRGAQQLAFFNGHRDNQCYMPVAGFVTFDHESEQYLVNYVLRPGNAPATRGAIRILRRLRKQLRAAFRRSLILVRLGGGFAAGEILDSLETRGRDAARRWQCQLRVFIKAEVMHHPGRESKMNPHFVVTNLAGSRRFLYE